MRCCLGLLILLLRRSPNKALFHFVLDIFLAGTTDNVIGHSSAVFVQLRSHYILWLMCLPHACPSHIEYNSCSRLHWCTSHPDTVHTLTCQRLVRSRPLYNPHNL